MGSRVTPGPVEGFQISLILSGPRVSPCPIIYKGLLLDLLDLPCVVNFRGFIELSVFVEQRGRKGVILI